MKKAVGFWVIVMALGVTTSCIATKQGYVSRGNKQYDAGKYQDAILNYRKAIQRDPNFGEAWYRLGLAAVKANDPRQAYEALLRATRLLPNNVDAKDKLADVCMAIYLADPSHPSVLYKQLTLLSDELLAANRNSYEGLMLKGYLADTDRKGKEAIEYFSKAVQLNDSNPGVITEYARLLIQDGQKADALKIATDLMARHKNYGPIYDLLYTTYRSDGQMGKAQDVLEAKVANNPTQADYVVQLARHYAGLQKPEEVAATLQRLIANPTNFPSGRLWVGDFYLGAGNYAEALRNYREGIRASKDVKQRVIYEKRAIVTLRAQGEKQRALDLAAQVEKEDPKDSEAMHLHADLALETGKGENANDAIREFQALSSQNPADASLQLQLGRAYQLKGDTLAARDHFQAALNKRPGFIEARLELASMNLAQQQYVEALEQVNEVLKLQPDNAKARLLHARVSMATGKWKDTGAELAKLLKDFPKDTEAQLEVGVLAILEHRNADAINIFGKLRDIDPRASAGLATAYASQQQMQKADEVINDALKKWPDSRILLGQMAGIQARNGNYDAAIGRLRQLLLKDPKNVQTLRRLGELYEAKGDRTSAINIYQQALELAPSDTDVALTLADTLARAGRNAEAKQHYEGILKLHPDNPGTLNNLAFFLADTGGNLDEALRLAQRALTKVPNQPAFSDTIGYIYLKKGLTDSAMQTFGSLVRQNPQFAVFHYHLGLAMVQKGDKAAARKELQSALKSTTLTPQDRVRVAELLSKIG